MEGLERKDAVLMTRVARSDRERLRQEARLEGLDLSSFVRMTLRRELTAREQRRDQPVAA